MTGTLTGIFSRGTNTPFFAPDSIGADAMSVHAKNQEETFPMLAVRAFITVHALFVLFFFPFIFVFNSCTCSPPPFFFLQLYVFIPTLATLSNLQFSLFKLTRGKVFSRVSPDVILWLTGLKASTN